MQGVEWFFSNTYHSNNFSKNSTRSRSSQQSRLAVSEHELKEVSLVDSQTSSLFFSLPPLAPCCSICCQVCYRDSPLFFSLSTPRRAPKTITKISNKNIRMPQTTIVRLFTILELAFVWSCFLNSGLKGGLPASCCSGSCSIITSESFRIKLTPHLEPNLSLASDYCLPCSCVTDDIACDNKSLRNHGTGSPRNLCNWVPPLVWIRSNVSFGRD